MGGVADVELGVVCSDCGGAHQDAVVLCAELVGEHSGRGEEMERPVRLTPPGAMAPSRDWA